MKQIVEIKLPPGEAHKRESIVLEASRVAGIRQSDLTDFRILKRSVDARQKRPVFRMRIELFVGEPPSGEAALLDQFKMVDDAPEVLIVGAGPAGYFAALELIEAGLKPIVFDRGKDVRSRRRDLRAIQQLGEVNPNSNYCFGEGGAGTYSDGKLYTRSHKRGNIYKALKLLVEHGATSDILIDAHPHIGSNKLPEVVANIRQTILHYGGQIYFDSLITDFISRNGQIEGIVVNHEKEFKGKAVILATGHSARDIYTLLHQKGITVEGKPFALGVRIEHPQSLIDSIQYGQKEREEGLPASSYRLACQVGKYGVFSFCMCPGGLVVPAATAPNEIVVNGMSLSRRDSPFANSGTVVSVGPEDFGDYSQFKEFAGLEFQRAVEQKMFAAGDGSQKAPAQRLTDFVEGKISSDLASTSYIPGLHSAALGELLPPFIYQQLRAGIKKFGKMMKGYYTREANVIGTESRTSSPIRIPRSKELCMHEDLEGLFPCGEGAGYAGGIISAAMDGQRVALCVARFMKTGKIINKEHL